MVSGTIWINLNLAQFGTGQCSFIFSFTQKAWLNLAPVVASARQRWDFHLRHSSRTVKITSDQVNIFTLPNPSAAVLRLVGIYSYLFLGSFFNHSHMENQHIPGQITADWQQKTNLQNWESWRPRDYTWRSPSQWSSQDPWRRHHNPSWKQNRFDDSQKLNDCINWFNGM